MFPHLSLKSSGCPERFSFCEGSWSSKPVACSLLPCRPILLLPPTTDHLFTRTQMCTPAHIYAHLHTTVHNCTQMFPNVHTSTQMCTPAHKCAQQHTNIHNCTQMFPNCVHTKIYSRTTNLQCLLYFLCEAATSSALLLYVKHR